MKKRPAILYAGIIMFVIAALLLTAVLLYKNSSSMRLKARLAQADEALEAGRLKEAADIYSEVQSADPGKPEVYECLMQLAYVSGDGVLLSDSYEQWLDLQIKAGNTDDERIDQMSGVINDMERREKLKTVSEMLAKEDYHGAQEVLSGLSAAGSDPDVDRACAALLIYLAERDSRLGSYETAEAYLKKAASMTEDDTKILKLLDDIHGKKLKTAIDRHDYTGAGALLDGTEAGGYADTIAACQERDGRIREKTDKLLTAIDKKDYKTVYRTLSDPGLKADVREMASPLYGKDDLVCCINNRPYIYYGGLKNGKREGQGKWVFIASDGRLVIYELEWKDDLPSGEGSCDRYSLDPSGEEAVNVHEHDEFSVSYGVMEGKYRMKTRVNSEFPYEYSVEYDLKNGYCPRIEPEDYPEVISMYMTYPTPIAGWTEAQVYDPAWKKEYTTTVWFNWTPVCQTVDGIDTGVAPAVVRNINL